MIDRKRIFDFNMPRFTTIKTADHWLSETFARNLHLDEDTEFEKFQADPSKAQVACQVSQTVNNRNYQQITQPQEAKNPPNGVEKTIQDVIPINPHSILLRPKPRPQMINSSIFTRHGAIHQQRHNQHHRRDPKSEKMLRCHYAPWAPVTTMTSGLRTLLQHLTNPPPPCSTNTMTLSGLGKRRREDWSSMNDTEAGGLDTILEEEVDKNEEEREESERFKRQRS